MSFVNPLDQTAQKLSGRVTDSAQGETEALHAFVPQPAISQGSEGEKLPLSEEERLVYVAKGQKLLEERLDKDVLDPKHSGHLDDKLFAHIHGDFHIKQTVLEGNQRSRTLKHFFYFLEKYQPFERQSEILEAFRKAPGYATRLEEIAAIWHIWNKDSKQEQLNQLAATITQDILGLGVGQKLAIHGGYQGSTGGHALLYKFSREKEGFTFEVLNTGDGLENHDPLGIKGKIKFYPFKRYEKIAADEALIRDFMQAALECMAPINPGASYNADYLYQKIFPMLKGIEVPVVPSEQDVITIQRAGTCTERVLHAYCRRHCMQVYKSIVPYKEFKLKFKRQTLIHYYQINKAANRLNQDTVLINLEKATAKWSRSIYKRTQARGVRDQELEEDLALLEAIKADLDAVKKRLKEPVKNVADVNYVALPITLEPSYPISVEATHTAFKEDAVIENVKPHLVRPNLDKVQLGSVEVYADYITALLERGKREDYFEAIQFFNAVLSKISFDISLWQNTKLLHQLERFADVAVTAYGKIRQHSAFPLSQPFLLYQCKVQYLMERLARNNPENNLSGFKLYSPLEDLKERCPRFIMTEAEHARNLSALMKEESDLGAGKDRVNIGFKSLHVDEDSLKSTYDSTVKYYIQFNKNDFSKTPLERLAAACGDMGSAHILPNDVIALKKQQLRIQWLLEHAQTTDLCSPLSHFTNKTERNKEGKFFIDSEIVSRAESGATTTTKFREKYPDDTREKAFTPLYQYLDGALTKIIADNGKIACTAEYPSYNDKRPLNENDVTLTNKSDDLTLEEIRDLQTLYVNGTDLPYNTIAVFEKYLPRLASKKYQEFFKLHFFKPNSLVNYLNHHPGFIRDIADFVTHGINFFEPLNKWEACLFFAEIGERVNHSPWLFPRRIDLLKKWYASVQDPKIKNQIAHHILSYYAKQTVVSPSDIEELFRVYVYAKSNPLHDGNKEYVLQEESERIDYRLPTLGMRLDENGALKDSLCEAVLKDAFVKKNQQSTWQGKYPIFETTEGETHYRINFQQGRIWVNRLPSHGLPKKIIEMQSFVELFPAKGAGAKAIGYNAYTFKEPIEAQEYNVKVFEKNIWCYTHCLIDGRWMQLASADKFDFILPSKELLRKGLYHWVECDPQGPNLKCVITDNKRQKLYEIEIEVVNVEGKEKWKNKRIVKMGKTPSELVILPERGEGPYKFLTLFEHKKWFTIWSENSHEGQIIKGSVNFPRYDLTFAIENGKAFSQRYPGYYIVAPEKWNGLGPQSKYLLLQNDKDEMKVCLQRAKREHSSQDYVSSQFTPDTDFQKEKQSFFAIDIDKKGNLCPKTTEEKLYLVYYFLCRGRRLDFADHALENLLSARLTKPLSPEENELIDWILDFESPTANFDPEINALRMKLFCLKEQQAVDFAGKTQNTWTSEYIKKIAHHLAEQFIFYLSNDSNNLLYHLKPHEEEFILRFIETHGSAGYLKKVNELMHLREKPVTIAKSTPELIKNVAPKSWNETEFTSLLDTLKQGQGNWKTAAEVKLLSFTHPERREFFAAFAALFTTALKGSKQERESLKRRLEILKVEAADTAMHQLRDYLLYALQAPESYKWIQIPEGVYAASPYPYTPIELADSAKSFLEYVHRQYTVPEATKPPEKKAHIEHEPLKSLREAIAKTSRELKKPVRGTQPLNLLPETSPVKKLQDYIHYSDEPNPLYALKDFRLKADFKDSVINKYIEDSNQELIDFFKNCNAKTPLASLLQPKALRTELGQTIQTQKSTLKKEKADLLQLANKKPENMIKRMLNRLNILGRSKQEITLKAFLSLYIQGNSAELRKRNPELTEDDVVRLMQKGADFFVKANDLKKCKRALAILDDLDALEKHNNEPSYASEKRQLIQKLAGELTSKRQYNDKMQPERIRACQVFEYLSNMQIRGKQITMIQNILDGKLNGEEREFIAQLIMGGGKSKVILPILALLMANGEDLSLLIIPKALIDTQKQYMTDISGGLFDQEANSFHFDADTPFTLQYLQDLHDRMVRIIHNREYLITTPETIEALELKWVECRKLKKKNQDIDPQLDDKMRALGDILRGLRSHAIGILDEADTVLHVRSELHITTGNQGRPIDPNHREFILSIYRLMTTDSRLKDHIQLCENKQVSKIKSTLPYIKNTLASIYAERFIDKPEERAAFEAYVKSEKSLKEVPECVRRLPLDKRDLIAILREELKTYLPITLARYGHQDYAYSKDNSVVFSIPAHHSEPVEGSQFGNHYEALNYTTQLVLQAGILPHIIERIVARLRLQSFTEMKRGVPLHKTQPYKNFEELYPHKGLFAVESDDWPAIAAHINQSIELRLKLAQTCLLSEIELHQEKISSDPIRFISMLNKVFGFTGTPSWNRLTYHRRLSVELDRGTDGFTMALLLHKASLRNAIVYLPEIAWEGRKIEEKVQLLVESMLKTTGCLADNLHHAMIDAGAFFKGMPMLLVAKTLLNALKVFGIKGIVFFLDNQLVILEEGKDQPIPLALSKLKPEERFSIYDDPHTIGVDIVQKFNAKAILSISENILLKDLLQAVWRLRQLDCEQSITFLISSECRHVINQLLERKDLDTPITMEDLLIFSAVNQAKLQGDDCIRSFKMQVVNEIRDILIHTTLQMEETDNDLAQEIFNTCDLDGIFSTEQRNEPFNQFGEIETDKNTLKVLADFRTHWLKKINEALDIRLAKNDGSDELKQKLTEIRAEIAESVNKIKLPQENRMPGEIPEKQRDNQGTEVQVQNKVEQKVNTQVQLQTRVTEDVQNVKTFIPIKPWNFSRSYDNSLDRLGKLYDVFYNDQARLYELKDAFKSDAELAPLAKWCEELEKMGIRISYSNNFHPDKSGRFYEKSQKYINHVSFYKRGAEVTVGLISEDDEKEIGPAMDDQNIKDGAAWIYDMRQRKIQRMTKDVRDYFATPAMAKTLIVLKVLNGETDYSEKEEAFLSELVEKVGADVFLKIFSRIVAHRDSKDTFEGSVLQKVLSKASGKQREAIQLDLFLRKQQELANLKRQKAELLVKQQEELKRKMEEERVALEQAAKRQKEEDARLLQERLQREWEELAAAQEVQRKQNQWAIINALESVAAHYFKAPETPKVKPAPQQIPQPQPVVALHPKTNLETILDLLKRINTQIANLVLSPFRRFTLLRGRPGNRL